MSAGERFQDRTLVGESPLGTFYRARDSTSGDTVLLRVTSQKLYRDAEIRQRIENERAALEQVSHRTLPSLVAFMVEDECAYLALKNYEGRQLSAAVGQQGLPIAEAVKLVGRLAEGVAVLHKNNCLHRFLIPWKVVVTEQRRIPLMTDLSIVDFGRSSELINIPKDVPLEQLLPFLPPEVVARKASDKRSDVYQLGMLLYYCLTGTTPYEGSDYVAAVARDTEGDTLPPSHYRDDIDETLDTLVLKLIARDPQARPSSANEVRTLLRPFIGSRTMGRPIISTQSHQRPSNKQPLLAGLFVVAVLTLGAAALFIGKGGRPDRPRPTRTPTVTKATKRPTPVPTTMPSLRPSPAPHPVTATNEPDMSPSALYAVAVCYHKGLGRPKSLEQAVAYYRKAAEKGEARAQNNLGYCLATGSGIAQHPAEAIRWFTKSAKQGNPDGACNVGIAYTRGFGVKRDLKTALQWLMGPAEQGHVRAQYHLGVAYEAASFVPNHKKRAVEWYRKAAQQNFGPALSSLGYCYHMGIGVERDPKQAIFCCRRAATLGTRKEREEQRDYTLSLDATNAPDGG